MVEIIGGCSPENVTEHAPMIEYGKDVQDAVYAAVAEDLQPSIEIVGVELSRRPGAYILALEDGRTIGFPYQIADQDSVSVL